MFKNDHTALAVTSLARSREFYESLGGVVVSKPSASFLEILLGELRLHLVLAERPLRREDSEAGIDHVCLRVGTLEELHGLRDQLNSCAAIARFAPFSVIDSPPLGEVGKEHCEERPPLKTLYFKDPDGIGFEVRVY